MLKAHEAQAEVEKLSAEVDNLHIDIDAMRHQNSVAEEAEKPEQPEVVQPVADDDAATIPDKAERTDAGGSETVIDDPDILKTMLKRGQMEKLFPGIPPQDFTDWCDPKKVKDGAERLAKLGYEAVKGKRGKQVLNYFRKLP